MPGKPLLRASLMLPLAALLGACDNNDTRSTGATGTTAPKTTVQAQVRQSLPGIWRPRSKGPLRALVLADDGQLYLVGGDTRRGVRWQKEKGGALRLEYLDHDHGARADRVDVDLSGDTLTLKGDSPLAGVYQRDAKGIDSVTGTATLPAGFHLDKPAVLAVTLVDLDAGDPAPVAVNRRLTRLPPGDADDLDFHLYFSAENQRPGHRYGVTARVIADGAVVLISAAPQPLPADHRGHVTLALQAPRDDG